MIAERVRFLFVDDDDLVIRALRRALQGPDWDFFFSSSPAEVLEQVERERIDVVVTDQAMPGMSGIALLKQLREQHPGVVRMLLTGHGDKALALQAINEGHVFRFLDKPWTAEALQSAVEAAAQEALKEKQKEQERRGALTGRSSVRLRPE